MTSRRPLYVIGTAGLAREMAQLVLQLTASGARWDFRGFIGESADQVGLDLRLGRVAGTDAWLLDRDEPADLVLGIGRPGIKAKVAAAYTQQASRFGFPNLVHPTAMLDPRSVELGVGNAVTAGCVLTVDIEVGDFNLLNLQTTVGHDARIGDTNVLNPGVNVSGGVRIGDRVLVGTGAQILEGLEVGSDASVGAGAVVTRGVEPGTTVVGVPARPLSRL